jgi:hypothetical protein
MSSDSTPVSALISAASLEAWGRKFQAPQYSIEIFIAHSRQ